MRDDDIVGAVNMNGLVKIHWRQWDGIDRPDHYYSEGLHPNRARFFAESLIKAADEADASLKATVETRIKELEAQQITIANELKGLKSELA